MAETLLPTVVTPPPPPRRPQTPTYKSRYRNNADISPTKQQSLFPYPHRTPSYPILKPLVQQTDFLPHGTLASDSSGSSNFASPPRSTGDVVNKTACFSNLDPRKSNSIALSTAAATAPLQMPETWSLPNAAAAVANPVRRENPGPFAVLVGCCAFATTIIALVIAAAVLATAFSTIGRRQAKHFADGAVSSGRRNEDLARNVAYALAHHNARRYLNVQHPLQIVTADKNDASVNEVGDELSDKLYGPSPTYVGAFRVSQDTTPTTLVHSQSLGNRGKGSRDLPQRGLRNNRQKRISLSTAATEYRSDDMLSDNTRNVEFSLPSASSQVNASSSLFNVFGSTNGAPLPKSGMKIMHWSSAALRNNISAARRPKIIFRTTTFSDASERFVGRLVHRTDEMSISSRSINSTVTDNKNFESIERDLNTTFDVTAAQDVDSFDSAGMEQLIENGSGRTSPLGVSHVEGTKDAQADIESNSIEEEENSPDDYGVMPGIIRDSFPEPASPQKPNVPHLAHGSEEFDHFAIGSRDTLSLVAVMCASLFPFLTALLVYSIVLKRKRRLSRRRSGSTESSPSYTLQHASDNGNESWTVVYSRRRSRQGRQIPTVAGDTAAAATVINMGNVKGLSYRRMGLYIKVFRSTLLIFLPNHCNIFFFRRTE